MSTIDKKIGKLRPVYLAEYDDLVKRHSQFGGGAKDDKFTGGKSFSNAYEFYMYAFYLGLYKNLSVEILESDKTESFWEIENWKPKELVMHLVSCAIAESEFDMVKIENCENTEASSNVAKIKNKIEEYANGGFKYISELLENEPDLVDDDMFFINLIPEG